VNKPSINPSQFEEQRYSHLFENLPICIFVADLTATPLTILEANRQTELVYGYTGAELVGMPADHLVPEKSRLTVLSKVTKGARQRRTARSFFINKLLPAL
jgi:PAS domain S-box-containing protein